MALFCYYNSNSKDDDMNKKWTVETESQKARDGVQWCKDNLIHHQFAAKNHTAVSKQRYVFTFSSKKTASAFKLFFGD